MSKIIVTGNNVTIENCVFDANMHSVNRSLIDCIGKDVTFKNCIIENIIGSEGKGAYGIFVNIEKSSSLIQSCRFRNITDKREDTDPVGYIKGMCGAILYTGTSYYLKSSPFKQTVENVDIDNIYTSLPNGEINNLSTDADGIRIFVNEKRTPKGFLDAQCYSFRNITGRDIQKRLIKVSGAANCIISNVYYKSNKKLSRLYPSHLIAVYDSDNIQISDVDYTSGCNDILFCGSNSSRVTINNVVVEDNGSWSRKSTSSLFRINKCHDLSICGLKFSGHYYRLGQLYESKGVEIQVDGNRVSCVSPIEIQNCKDIKLAGSIRNIKMNSSTVFILTNVDGISVDEGIGHIENARLFKFVNCSGISISRKRLKSI